MNLEFQRMTYMTIAIVAGLVLDLIFGDPRWLYHPVRLIGHLIWEPKELSETVCRRIRQGNASVEGFWCWWL